MEEIVYFSINNWFSGRDYPPDEIFSKWVENRQFSDNEWCKKNRLCVKDGCIDMSLNWCVAAPKSWVEANCPKLLTDEEYTYTTLISDFQNGSDKWKEEKHTKKYSDFVYKPDEDGNVYDRFDWPFPKYCEENFGCEWYEEEPYEDEEEEDD